MLRSETLFGKREPASGNTTPNSPLNVSSAQSSVAKPGSPTSVGKPPSAAPGQTVSDTLEVSGGSKLIVGHKIKLRGEISDCDTLVVKGQVEAAMESRMIQIAESGTFKGSILVDVAEINGTFDGHLTARQKLVIHSTGKVTGTIRFGKIVIEEGGQLSGDVQVGIGSKNRNNLSVAHVAISAVQFGDADEENTQEEVQESRMLGRQYIERQMADALENLSLADAAALGGMSEQAVNNARKDARLYALIEPSRQRGHRYPRWQFGVPNGRLERVLAPFKERYPDCWAIHEFMTQPNYRLGGKVPRDVILNPSVDIETLVRAASAYIVTMLGEQE